MLHCPVPYRSGRARRYCAAHVRTVQVGCPLLRSAVGLALDQPMVLV